MNFSFRKINDLIVNNSVAKWQIKSALALLAILIFFAMVYYTQTLIQELVEREKNIINLYTKLYAKFYDQQTVMDYYLLMDDIIPTITFPMIITDKEDQPIFPYEQYSMNVNLDSTLSVEKQKEYMIAMVADMKRSNPPVVIKDNNGNVLQKFYYKNSFLVDKLRYFPFVEILIIASFVFIGYMAFSNIRRSEESKVWVGMAKEAAHQLGTPLSSLLAWLEILKYNKHDAEYVEETIHEMESDVTRLNIIATRFSKIGSKPDKSFENISEVIENVCLYFEKRLPHLGRHIEVIRILDDAVRTEINVDLFQWVIENLLKNAAEAIENKRGKVTVEMKSTHKMIFITIADTGKGLSKRQKHQIFYPGYTTKKRGWGLGLSLARRIVEDYHDGKIYVKDSSIGKGTTFAIELPCYEANKKKRIS